MKPEILLVGEMMAHVEQALGRAYAVHRVNGPNDRGALDPEAAGRIRGIATSGHIGVSVEVMEALPRLEIVGCFGVGVDAIDLSYARRREVIVTNTPGVLDEDVANLAVTLVLAVSRRIVACDRYVRAGRWRDGFPPLAHSVRGKTVGILGLGRIGKSIARKLEVFSCHIVYHGRHEQTDQPYRYYADLASMARDSDYLIAICPGGAGTRHLVNGQVLEALGPEGTFINVSRGSVHDEAALVAALNEGRLGAAGLDVFADEPNVPEPLLAMDNVVLLPHQGSATIETRRAMGDLVVENLARHFAGKPVVTRVT